MSDLRLVNEVTFYDLDVLRQNSVNAKKGNMFTLVWPFSPWLEIKLCLFLVKYLTQQFLRTLLFKLIQK